MAIPLLGAVALALAIGHGVAPASRASSLAGLGPHFTPAGHTSGSQPYGVAIYHGTGANNHASFAVTNYGGASVTAFKGDGAGGFVAQTIALPTGTMPRGIVAGNFGDGCEDLAVSDFGGYVDILMQNTGGGLCLGTFSATVMQIPLTPGVTPDGIAAGRIYGAALDLVVADRHSGASGAGAIVVLKNVYAGSISFTPQPAIATGGTGTRWVKVGDLGTSNPDVVASNFGSANITIFVNSPAGTLTALTPIGVGSGPEDLAIGHIDYTGNTAANNIIVTNYFSHTLTVLKNTGAGFALLTTLSSFNGPTDVVIGDFNGDGHPDLAVTEYDGNDVTVWSGDGSGFPDNTGCAPNHCPRSSAATNTNPFGMAAAAFDEDVTATQLNRDGSDADLVTADFGSAEATVLTNDTDTTAPAPVVLNVTGPAHSGFVSSATQFSITATDGDFAGVASTLYCIDTTGTCTPGLVAGNSFLPSGTGGNTQTGASFALGGPNGAYHIRFAAQDFEGNQSATADQTFTLDATAPTTSLGDTGVTVGPHRYVSNATTFTATSTDNAGGSGVAAISWCALVAGTPATYCGGAAVHTTSGAGPLAFTLSSLSLGDGAYDVYAWATDNVGNVEAHTTPQETVRLDNTPPQPSITLGAGTFTDTHGTIFARNGATITLSATDAGSGVASVSYCVDSHGAPACAVDIPADTYPGSSHAVSLPTTEGAYDIYYSATDNLGNSDPPMVTITVDTTAPTAALAPSGGTITNASTITLTGDDGTGSGVASLAYRCYPSGSTPPAFTTVNGSSTTFQINGANGPFTCDYYATDHVGNSGSGAPQHASFTLNTPPSTGLGGQGPAPNVQTAHGGQSSSGHASSGQSSSGAPAANGSSPAASGAANGGGRAANPPGGAGDSLSIPLLLLGGAALLALLLGLGGVLLARRERGA